MLRILIFCALANACATAPTAQTSTTPVTPKVKPLRPFSLPPMKTLSGTILAQGQPSSSDKGLGYNIPVHPGLPPMNCVAGDGARNTSEIVRDLAAKLTALGDQPADTQQIRAAITPQGLPYLSALTAAYKNGTIIMMTRIAAVVGLGQHAFCVGYEPHGESPQVTQAQEAFFDGLRISEQPLERAPRNVALLNIKMDNGWEPGAGVVHNRLERTDQFTRNQSMVTSFFHTNKGDLSLFSSDWVITPKSNQDLAAEETSSINNGAPTVLTYRVDPGRTEGLLITSKDEPIKGQPLKFEAPFKTNDEIEQWLRQAAPGDTLKLGYLLDKKPAVAQLTVTAREGAILEIAMDWAPRKGTARFHTQHGWLDFKGTLSGAPTTMVWPFHLKALNIP